MDPNSDNSMERLMTYPLALRRATPADWNDRQMTLYPHNDGVEKQHSHSALACDLYQSKGRQYRVFKDLYCPKLQEVKTLVQSVFGTRTFVRRVDPIQKGYVNPAFLLHLSCGRFVLSVCLGSPTTIHHIERCHRYLWGQDFPVPEPIFFESHPWPLTFVWHVSRFVPGIDGDEFLSLHRDQNNLVLRKMGRLLAELHSIVPPTKHMAQSRSQYRSQSLSWSLLVKKRLKRVSEEALINARLPRSEIMMIQQYCRESSFLIPDSERRILHGDFHPRNLRFSRSGDIVALFDWEHTGLGNPEYDFRSLETNVFPIIGGRQAFFQGYREIMRSGHGYEDRKGFYLLLNSLEIINRARRIWLDPDPIIQSHRIFIRRVLQSTKRPDISGA
jgi:aminoglycoside phosphotransferase (APT) family kinase protein